MNKALMSDEDWHKTEQYKKIQTVMNNLVQTGMIERFSGNCIGASDLIQNYLNDVGIHSKLVEVKVSFIYKQDGAEGFYFLGYDNLLKNPSDIDTHVVVITETDVPMVIDASISHLLPFPKDKLYICERINVNDLEIMATYDYGVVKLTYRIKGNLRIPSLHQKTILQKEVETRKHREMLRALKVLVWVSIGITGINFTINMTLIGLNLHQIELKHVYNQGKIDGN